VNARRPIIRVPILMLAVALCAFAGLPARASFLLLNDPSEFSATQTLITFDEGDFDGTFLQPFDVIASYRGVGFQSIGSAPPQAAFDPSTPREFGPGGIAGQTILNSSFYPLGQGLMITLPGQMDQFGAEFEAVTPGNFSFTLFDQGQQVDVVTIASGPTGHFYSFHAFEDSSFFDQVLVRGPGVLDGRVLLDNLRFAPEPATLALLGIGLAGLGFSRRKQQMIQRRREPRSGGACCFWR
jgi:hypothetical protein